MHNPPLCQLWQLTQTGPGTYDVCELMDMHEAIDIEIDFQRRRNEANTPREE